MGLEEKNITSHISQLNRNRINPAHLTSLLERIFTYMVSQEKRCSFSEGIGLNRPMMIHFM